MRDSSRPRICATLAVPTLKRLSQAADLAISQGADLLELRLDHLSRLPNPRELEWCKSLGVPVIATIRNASEGGCYNGPEEKKISYLTTLEDLCQLVDIELTCATPGNVATLRQGGFKVLLSHHDFRSTPREEELLSILCRAKALGGDLCKIATVASTAREILRVLSLPAIISPTVVVTLGENGILGRILAPLFGSEFAYAHPDGFPPAAPGMLSIQTMRRIYQVLEETLDRRSWKC